MPHLVVGVTYNKYQHRSKDLNRIDPEKTLYFAVFIYVTADEPAQISLQAEENKVLFLKLACTSNIELTNSDFFCGSQL